MSNVIRLLSATAIGLALAGAAHAETLTVYTAGPGSLIKKLAAGYTETTGNDVEVFQATTGKVMARLAAEAANPIADVVISASWDTATQFDSEGLLLDYTSPNAATVPDFLKADDYVAQGISALAIAWNTNSGTPEPSDWSDLTKPEYKDLVTMPDPASSGSAYELVSALTAAPGIGWELFEGLAENDMIVPGANAEALNPVLQGAKAVVFGAVDYQSFDQIDNGESIKVIFPTTGTVIAPRPMMILKSSEHQDAAKAFIDYVLSEDGQAIVASTHLMPARADIGADRPLISDLKLLDADASADRQATLDQFSGLFK